MLGDKRISLDPRLSTIAEMLGHCPVCADIGSDHGRLGAFLLQNHRCQHVCLTDISAPSLEKARKIERYCAERIGGLALPRFVADIPGSKRKVPLDML